MIGGASFQFSSTLFLMIKRPVFVAALSFFALGFAARSLAAEAPKAPPAESVVYPHGKVDNAFAGGMPLLLTTEYKIQTGNRKEGVTYKVEVHDKDTDIFYITEGGGTLVTGGTAVGMKTTESGEQRGDSINGGTTRQVTKGDVVVIPAGQPHWFSKIDGSLVYFVVKVTKQ